MLEFEREPVGVDALVLRALRGDKAGKRFREVA